MSDAVFDPPRTLILASGSPYRARLLERLKIPFTTRSPLVDERSLAGEGAMQMALRLAVAKAQAVDRLPADPLIIGSDQVAACDNRLLGKPGTRERACEQLAFCSGKHVVFFTGLAIWRPEHDTLDTAVETVEVALRTLTREDIEAYVDKDTPFDCAGSFKWESLGISLFRRMTGPDPTALEGLPLIALCELLRKHGYTLP